MAKRKSAALLLLTLAALAGCGIVKEKTAPCKRSASLVSFVEDRRKDCGLMHAVNDPASAFAAIGVPHEK
jgi:hypothetical protein